MRNRRITHLMMIIIALVGCVFVNGSALADDKKGPGSGNYVSGELLVKFQKATTESEKNQVRQMAGAVLIREIQPIRVEYWKLPEGVNAMEAVEQVAAMPVVEYAEPNYLYAPQMEPDDTYFNRLWYLENSGQRVNGKSGITGADISAEEAWDLETGSADIVIAVLDSGVAFDHPDLANNIWRNPEEIPDNGIDDDNLINSLTGFSIGVERLVIWSNDADFDDFCLRFSLITDNDVNYDGVYIDDVSLTGINWKFTGDEYGYKSGTSMATPVVAGVAGLVWSANPDLTHLQVKKILLSTVDPLPDLAGRVVSNGRINAAAAVQAAIDGSGTDGNPDKDGDAGDTNSDSSGSGDGGCFIRSLLPF